MRGVIAAQAGGVLSREADLSLGVRQSIFPDEPAPEALGAAEDGYSGPDGPARGP